MLPHGPVFLVEWGVWCSICHKCEHTHTHVCTHTCTHSPAALLPDEAATSFLPSLSGVSSPPGGSSSVLILLVAGLKAWRPTPLDLSTVIILTSSPPPRIPSLLLCNVNQTYWEWINRDTSRHAFICTRGNTDQMMEPGYCWRFLTFSKCKISKTINFVLYTLSLKLRPQEKMCLMLRLTQETWGIRESAFMKLHKLQVTNFSHPVEPVIKRVRHRIQLQNHLRKHLLLNYISGKYDAVSFNNWLFKFFLFWSKQQQQLSNLERCFLPLDGFATALI